MIELMNIAHNFKCDPIVYVKFKNKGWFRYEVTDLRRTSSSYVAELNKELKFR